MVFLSYRAIRGRLPSPVKKISASKKGAKQKLGVKSKTEFKHVKTKKCKAVKKVSLNKGLADEKTASESSVNADKNENHNCANVNFDGPSTSGCSSNSSLSSHSKPFHGTVTLPRCSSNEHSEEGEKSLEEENRVESIQGGEPSFNSDVGHDEYAGDGEEEEGDSHSDLSDSVYSLLSQRSRIPVPINSSLVGFRLVYLTLYSTCN